MVAYRIDLLQFTRYIGDTDLGAVTPGMIDAFLGSLHLSRASLQRKLAAISSFFTYLKKRDIMSANPADEVESFKLPRRKPDYLSREEISVLRNASSSLLVATLFEFLLSTGIRRSEACSLNRRQLDLENRQARVTGKGSKERIVMFSEYCASLLEAYLRTHRHEAVFANEKGTRRLSIPMLYYRIQKLSKAVGRNIYPHLCRHSFATHLLEGGLSIAEVQELMGHGSITATAVYVHPTAVMQKRYDEAIKGV